MTKEIPFEIYTKKSILKKMFSSIKWQAITKESKNKKLHIYCALIAFSKTPSILLGNHSLDVWVM